MSKCIDTQVATADPPSTGVSNPIHDAAGADAAGYAGALVAGVRTYGWAAATITRCLGEQWLEHGWVDYTLRRPLYAGELLRTVVEKTVEKAVGNTNEGNTESDTWTITCTALSETASGTASGTEERVVLTGTAGLADAPWFGDLKPPAPAPGLDALESLPGYNLETIPLWAPLRPLTVFVSLEAAENMVVLDLGLEPGRYLRNGDEPGFVHPFFLAGRMAPLTRHNFTYGATIHVRSQIQHRREARANCRLTAGAQIVQAYDRNEHWYQVLDGIVTDEIGELAIIRHHTIFRPRGT